MQRDRSVREPALVGREGPAGYRALTRQDGQTGSLGNEDDLAARGEANCESAKGAPAPGKASTGSTSVRASNRAWAR
jgi:hypothetical protein